MRSSFILLILLVLGCKEETTVVKTTPTTSQDLNAEQYSTYYYFIDTLYRNYWAPLHQTLSPELSPEMQDNQIIQLDLCMSVPQSTQNVSKIFKARAYTDLPSRLLGQDYPDNVEDSLATYPGERYSGNFIQLEPGKDYKFSFTDPRQLYGGYIVLNTSIPDEQALAVTYTVLGRGQPRSYGTRNQAYNDTTRDGYYLLKLIKPPGLVSNPGYRTAWKLQLKNIYPVGGRDLIPEGLTIQIIRRTQGADVDQINTENLLKVLGLDRFDANLRPIPDNIFDFIPGLTVDVERAELIFPTLRPFDSTIAQYFRSIQKPLSSDSLLFGDIYDTTYTAAQNNLVKNRYFIRVTSEVRNP
jgi:cell surface protein SprA